MWEEILAFIGQLISSKEGARIVAAALHTVANVLEQEAENLDTVAADGTAPAPTDGTTPTPTVSAFRSMPRP